MNLYCLRCIHFLYIFYRYLWPQCKNSFRIYIYTSHTHLTIFRHVNSQNSVLSQPDSELCVRWFFSIYLLCRKIAFTSSGYLPYQSLPYHLAVYPGYKVFRITWIFKQDSPDYLFIFLFPNKIKISNNAFYYKVVFFFQFRPQLSHCW